MKEIIKKINIICFLVILFGFGILHIIIQDKVVDRDERRYLSIFPKFSVESIRDGKYYDEFEDYMLDQTPFRTRFRELKSFTNYNIFYKQENENVIIKDGVTIKVDLNYGYEKVSETIKKLKVLKQKLFSKNKIYFALVPDKNCYLETNGVDYNKVFESIKINGVNNINLYNQLILDKYYKTDTHWNQIEIVDVANYILSQMNIEINNIEYNIINNGKFKGVLSSQGALSKTDDLNYLYNDILANCVVYDYETNKETVIYNVDKLLDEKCLDMYDIFLSGSVPLIRIDNPNANNDKALIVFRDSFGSSITPLFAPYYSNIYVVDLRYINSKILSNYLKVNGDEDVLFLYSTTLLAIPENFQIS